MVTNVLKPLKPQPVANNTLGALSTGMLRVYNTSSRSDPATITSGSSTIADISILASDLGKPVTGTGIPAASYVGTITAATSFVLVNGAGTAVVATASSAGAVIGGSLAPVLPALSGVADDDYITVEKDSLDPSGNAVVVTCAGSDTFANGSTTVSLTVKGERLELQAATINGTRVWKSKHHSIPKAGLDTIYGPNTSGYTTAVQLLKWRKALSQMRNGTRDAKILCIGDSTTFGIGSTPTAKALGGYPARLAALLNSYYAPAANGLAGANTTANDTRWTLGAGWANDGGNNGWANIDLKASASSGALVFTPGAAAGTFDTFDVWYIATGNTPAFTIQATGGSAVTVTPGAADAVVKATCTAAAAGTGNSVSITTLTGALRVVGVEPSLSTAKKIRVGNAGFGGSSAAGWNTSVSNPKYGSVGCITGYAPDLTIIDLGINDAPSSGGTTAFGSNLLPLITAAKLSGDVILKTFVPSYNDGILGPNEASILNQINALAVSQGCPVVDVNSRWVSYVVSNALGYYSDVLHPNDDGYQDVAQTVYNRLAQV